MKKKTLSKSLEEELAFPDLHKNILQLFKDFPRGRVFDGAAGNGILSKKLRGMGFRVISTDVERKGNLQKEIDFFQSDLNLDFALRSGQFDYCVCLETIEHLENPWHFVRELARILKPGGRLILSTPNIDYLSCKICFLLHGSFYPFFNDWQYEVIGHITPLSKTFLKRILTKYGFEVEEVTYNRYRIPYFKKASPIRLGIFGESLIVVAAWK